MPTELPQGQRASKDFFRFGSPHFAFRFPKNAEHIEFKVLGDIQHPCTVSSALQQLTRVEQISDFHCVTTWSCCRLAWSGYRFSDCYRDIVLPTARPDPAAQLVIFRGQDGYASTMLLQDLLADDVMLADRFNGSALGIEHGAALRLIAPAH